MQNISEKIRQIRIQLPSADWKDFGIDAMNREEDALLTELRKYYEYEKAMIPDLNPTYYDDYDIDLYDYYDIEFEDNDYDYNYDYDDYDYNYDYDDAEYNYDPDKIASIPFDIQKFFDEMIRPLVPSVSDNPSDSDDVLDSVDSVIVTEGDTAPESDSADADDDAPEEVEYPLFREWHPSLLLAYELGYLHKDHSIPDDDAGPGDVLKRLSKELFPGNSTNQKTSRAAFISCASLYFSFLYTLQYFQEDLNKSEADLFGETLRYLPFRLDFREMATWKNFITWLSSMVGKQIRNPVIDFKNELKKEGNLGFDGLEETALRELEIYFVDIAPFWNSAEYAPALEILACAITKNAPYTHFYDGFTHGQHYLGKKSQLYANIEPTAQKLLKTLKDMNLVRQEDSSPVDWLCTAIENAPRHDMKYLLSCPCFFIFIHAATTLPYAKKKVTEYNRRPVWGTEQVELWGWDVLRDSRYMLKNELQKFSWMDIYFEPGLFWMQTPKGYNMAACHTGQ